VVAGLGLLAVSAAVVQLVALTLSGNARTYAIHAAWVCAGLGALGAMAAAARRVPGVTQRRGGWLFVAATSCWLAGALAHGATALGAPSSLASAADGLWLATVAFASIGLAVRAPRGLISFRLFLLDAMPLVGLAAAIALVASRTVHDVSIPGAIVACLFAMYTIPAAVTLQLMALDGLRRATSAWWYFALGWTSLAIAAITWPAFGQNTAPIELPAWQGSLWTAGMLLLTVSGIQRARDTVRSPFRSSERESSRRAVPAAAATLALLVLAVFERSHLGIGVLALFAFVSFAARSAIARETMGRMVSDLVRSREALADSERRFRSIFESTAIGVCVWSLDGRILEANRALEKMLGYGAGELAGRSFPDLTHPDHLAAGREVRNRLLRGERQSLQSEERFVRRDGEILWARVTPSLIREGRSGSLLGISAIEDIDVRRRAEASLAAAEARYRTLVEQLPFITYVADLGGPSATFISPQIETIVGYTVEEWTSDPELFQTLLHPDDRDRVLASFANLRGRGEPVEIEYRIAARDGRTLWCRDAAAIVRDEAGQPLHVQGHVMDISEHRRSEEGIVRRQAILEAVARVSEALLSAAGWEDVADDVLRVLGEGAGVSRAYVFENRTAWDGRELSYQRFEWTAPGIESFLNDAKLQGFDLGEAHGRIQATLVAGGIVAGGISGFSPDERHELEREGIKSLLIAPIMAGGRWWGWLGFDECTSERVWAEGEIDAVRAAAGTLAAAIQREHAEATEQEAVQTLAAVIEASPAAIVGLDRAGCVIMWNPAAETMFGWRAVEVLGRPNPNVPQDGQDQFEGLLSRGISGDSWSDLEIVRRHRDGRKVHVSSSAAPLRDGSGEIVGAVAVLVDIDERKAAERERERLLRAEQEARAEAEVAREQLAEQNERLVELDALKDEFVALVSHELRTPLTSILGYLDLVLDPAEGSLSEEQREFLTVVERNSKRLLRLVGDLLFLAQADAGKLTFEREQVDLAAIGRECVEAARPSADEKGIELHLHADTIQPFEGDRVRLTQLIDNLVSNAVKFTPPAGRVEVTVEQRGHRLVLSVADTGIGVSEDEQRRLFERFFRTTNATREAIQGSGLGLAITKTIAEGHGGRITFASREGVGTTFWVEFPARLALAA